MKIACDLEALGDTEDSSVYSYLENNRGRKSMKSILVVEDSKAIQALIKATLVNAGYDVHTSYNGFEAITSLKERDVDLIITDIHMPKMNGARLVTMLHNRHSDTPILVITSDKTDKTKEEFRGKSVKGWLNKPIESVQLLTAVNTLLN